MILSAVFANCSFIGKNIFGELDEVVRPSHTLEPKVMQQFIRHIFGKSIFFLWKAKSCHCNLLTREDGAMNRLHIDTMIS